ncbi:2'-5' RNA ligase family protein [Pedococcus sp. NPDC057267]|uniref:2'-5' RNA ligase family protein n=1 Tax=Pedococcus sp. NPDC057267 TaxID=3346077 RepID=UPI00362C6BD0
MSEHAADNLYADHNRMANHWWWRPGWQMGTQFYAWHITLDGQDDLHRLMDAYSEALQPFPTLDPVPRQWRHITLQGLGHVEDVTDADRRSAVAAVAARLAHLQPIKSTFGRPVVFKEAIALPPSKPNTYAKLRREIRAGIADAWGFTPEKNEGFRAHTSVAYSNSKADGRAIRLALDEANVSPATATFAAVSLIRMNRDHRMYEWTTVDAVNLGPSSH